MFYKIKTDIQRTAGDDKQGKQEFHTTSPYTGLGYETPITICHPLYFVEIISTVVYKVALPTTSIHAVMSPSESE